MYQQYPQQQPAYYPQQQYSGCLKAFLYILSFLVAMAGVIIGIVFISRHDPESKSLGNACLIVGIISFVVWCCLSIVFGISSGFLAAWLENM